MSEALQSLIERVEKATGPDREIDCAIAVAIDGFWAEPEKYEGGGALYCTKAPDGTLMRPGQAHDMLVPSYTASIDAALSLVSRVLPGAGWRVEQNSRDGAAFAILWRDVDVFEQFISDPCSTPALALCLALLRAVSTVQAKNEATEDTRG